MPLKVIPLPRKAPPNRLLGPVATPPRRAGRHCEICRHPNRDAIDLAIIAGDSKRAIAERFGSSPSSVQRHREHCVPADIVQAQRSKRIDRAEYLLASSCALDRKAAEICEEAQRIGRPNVALSAISERRRILALQAGIRPSERPAQAGPEATDLELLKKVIIDGLADHPEARVKLAEVLANTRNE